MCIYTYVYGTPCHQAEPAAVRVAAAIHLNGFSPPRHEAKIRAQRRVRDQRAAYSADPFSPAAAPLPVPQLSSKTQHM